MRLKATPLTCAFAWAPESLGTPTFLAAASVAGAIDDNFSGEAFLEIRLVDVTQTDETEMPVLGRTVIPAYALRVDWGPVGGERGIIAVSCEDGAVYIYDAAVMMNNYKINANANTEEARLAVIAEHQGAVRGCQFNPLQPTFLAIGADDGAWDVWMLNDPREPQRVPIMPDSVQPAGITHLQWNPKWPHILATSVANGVVNVWNLKNQTLAASLHVAKGGKSGSSGNVVAWHPSIATQIAVGLDEKHPAIQIWDLKKAVMPLREILGHQNAVTGLAWSMADHAILASCDADGKTLWWDPSTGEQSGALQREGGYMVDVQWSRTLPVVLATSSFEPLFCVSTAEVASATPPGGAAVQKSLQRPCGASIGIGGLVASVSTRSANAIKLTRVVESKGSNPSVRRYADLVAEISRLPPASLERVEWLKAHQYPLVAAAAACKNDRTPILSYLAEDTSTEESEDPFETMQGAQRTLEDIAASHVAAGRIDEAVEACLDEREFGDAFAIAYLQGGKLMQRVQQEYTKYILNNSQGKRHIVYASAIASGDFQSLMAGGNTLWKEALSVIISFVGDKFSEACDKLAFALKDAGNRESAMTCFVCSGNVDAIAELWHEDGVPVDKLVQDVLILEEVTGRKVTSAFFADYLYEYALALLKDGVLTTAMSFFQRSASIGNISASIMVDRMRFEVPGGQMAFPFAMTPLPDAPSELCVAFMAGKGSGQQQQQPQATAPPQHQQQHPPVTQTHYQQQCMSTAMQSQQQPVAPSMQPPYQPQHVSTPTQPATRQQLPVPTQQNAYGAQQQVSAPGTFPPQSGSMAPVGRATPPPRLMPHPISSWSSLGSASEGVTTRPPLPTTTMTGYGGASVQNLPNQQLQGRAPGAHAPLPPPPPGHVDPQQPTSVMPPPSRGSSLPTQPTRGAVRPLAGQPLPPQQQMEMPLAPTLPISAPGQQPSGPRGMPFPPTGPSGMESNFVPTTGAPPMGSAQNGGKISPSPEPSSPQAGGAVAPPASLLPPSAIPGRFPPSGTPNGSQGANWGANVPCAANQQLQAPPLPPGVQSVMSGSAGRPPPAGGALGYPPAMGPGAPPRAPASVGRPPDDFGLSQFDVSALNPEHQDLAQKLRNAVQQVTNTQRRSAVAKAAVELFRLLQTGVLSQDVIRLLSEYINSLGSQQSKDAWRQLAVTHFAAIQHILNLKFLQ